MASRSYCVQRWRAQCVWPGARPPRSARRPERPPRGGAFGVKLSQAARKLASCVRESGSALRSSCWFPTQRATPNYTGGFGRQLLQEPATICWPCNPPFLAAAFHGATVPQAPQNRSGLQSRLLGDTASSGRQSLFGPGTARCGRELREPRTVFEH